MSHDENVLAAFEFHDDGFEADDHITIRFSSWVAVVVLVFVAGDKVLWVAVLDFLVRETIAHA